MQKFKKLKQKQAIMKNFNVHSYQKSWRFEMSYTRSLRVVLFTAFFDKMERVDKGNFS